MLPPFIIDELRRRERWKEDHERQQPVVELPLPEAPRRNMPQAPEERDRGVTVIPLF